MFHYLFPITTMGLAPFVAWFTLRAWQTRDEHLARAAAFWTKIFTINFAVGVVTRHSDGVSIRNELGRRSRPRPVRSSVSRSRWRASTRSFSSRSFSAALLRAQRDLPSRLHAIVGDLRVARLVAIGIFHRRDRRVDAASGRIRASHADGTIHMTSLPAVLLSPFAWWQYAHVIVRRDRRPAASSSRASARTICSPSARRRSRSIFVRNGTIVALRLCACSSIFPTGDRNGADVTTYQPIKLAAMEGLFESTQGRAARDHRHARCRDITR